MEFLFYVVVFIFGLIIGSFLNSLIYRLEINESFLWSRSYCPHCKTILSWKDLIPILSFFILKGKCRYCRERISLQYPLVELATGILFLFPFFLKLSSFIDLIFYWFIFCVLIVIFVYDLKHYLIPEKLVYLAILFTLFYHLFKSWTINNLDLLFILNLIFAIFPSLFFLTIILISRETWMGWGDFQLSILMGLILGWPNILVALFFAFFIGFFVSLILILLKKKTMKSQIPFAPFLVVGTFLAMFLGKEIINWYLKFGMIE